MRARPFHESKKNIREKEGKIDYFSSHWERSVFLIIFLGGSGLGLDFVEGTEKASQHHRRDPPEPAATSHRQRSTGPLADTPPGEASPPRPEQTPAG